MESSTYAFIGAMIAIFSIGGVTLWGVYYTSKSINKPSN